MEMTDGKDVNADVFMLVNGTKMKMLLDEVRRLMDEMVDISFGSDDEHAKQLMDAKGVLCPAVKTAMDVLEAPLDLMGVTATMDIGYRD